MSVKSTPPAAVSMFTACFSLLLQTGDRNRVNCGDDRFRAFFFSFVFKQTKKKLGNPISISVNVNAATQDCLKSCYYGWGIFLKTLFDAARR